METYLNSKFNIQNYVLPPPPIFFLKNDIIIEYQMVAKMKYVKTVKILTVYVKRVSEKLDFCHIQNYPL